MKTKVTKITRNVAGGLAYKLDPRQALAQYASTGCFGNTFYTRAEDQLEIVLNLCKKVDDDYVTKVAIYAGTVAKMQDMAILLVAYLSTLNDKYRFHIAFDRVITDGR
jgi:60 kDa SS-A/Ro ribonucleoprotein